MQPKIETFRQYLSGSIQFRIPPYQREYQWGPEQWHTLWRDIGVLHERHLGGAIPVKPHFFGIILIDPKQEPGAAGEHYFNVIDGQQRLVTLLLLLAAIRDATWERDKVPHDKKKLNSLYHVRNNDGETIGVRLKAQEKDSPDFTETMEYGWKRWDQWYGKCRRRSEFSANRIRHAYFYFRHNLWLGRPSFSQDVQALFAYKPKELAAGDTVYDVWESRGEKRAAKGDAIDFKQLEKIVFDQLEVLTLTLQPEDEDAPTIFDSINAKRTELQQWDFIRNLIFIQFPEAEAHALYKTIWSPVQDVLGNATWIGKRSDARDAFIYDYLIARGEHRQQGSIGRNRGFEHLANRLRRLVPPKAKNDETYRKSLRSFVTDDLLTAAKSWPVSVGISDKPIGEKTRIPSAAQLAIESIGKLSSGPPTPAVLHFVEGWQKRKVTDGELVESLQLIEAVLARALLAKKPLSPLRSVFMAFMDELAGNYDLDHLRKTLRSQVGPDKLCLPDNALRAFAMKESYYKVPGVNGSQLGAIFRGIERELAGPRANPMPYGKQNHDFTVEHIFPRSCCKAGKTPWSQDLKAWGSTAAEMKGSVDCLGNLTLLTLEANRHVKAKAFAKKKAMLIGKSGGTVKHPLLRINQSVDRRKKWTVSEIEARTAELIDTALKHWPAP